MGFLSYLKPSSAEKTEAPNANATTNAGRGPTPTISPHGPSNRTSTSSSSGRHSRTGSRSSRLNSIDENDAARDSVSRMNNELKYAVMVNGLYQQQVERCWITKSNLDDGVILKKSKGVFTSCPAVLSEHTDGFFKAIELLNVRAAMTVDTKVIRLFLQNINTPYVPLENGLRLQVMPSINYLPRCQKHHFAAFIADRGVLVVWDDEPRHLIERAADIEKSLVKMVWENTLHEDEMEEKKGDINVEAAEVSSDEDTAERGATGKPRNTMLLMAILSACTLMLTTLAMGVGYRKIAIEILLDGDWLRLAFLAVLPIQIWIALFFFQALVTNVFQVFGPVSQVHQNTKFYSGIRPKRLSHDTGALPHVTIQMPVYKEGLHGVIEPTVASLKAAISTYEMQGGTANIFVNDDGMQLISPEDARARRDFYDEHNIGWVARPKHNPKPAEGEEMFLRRGKFKKASNMNYAMWASNRVEEKLSLIQRHDHWTEDNESTAYRQALDEVIKEDEGRTWADGNIRIGDYILLIDSDTRVPVDCFLDSVSEMEQCPQVAILQYSSGVMNVTNSFFERGITFFTNLIYTQIRYAVATGDVAPFVGHNAILRWAAVQAIAYDCPADAYREKYWSEATVSEDFDMALRLQTAGYIVRLASYTGSGFQEGVSLTVYDELARWEKYAYGCSELIFHPFIYWPTRGPFTKLFRNFITSSMPLPSKFSIMAYIGTYYALGSAWILTLANYFLIGWLNGHIDHFYLDSFKVYVAILTIFTGLGNVSLAVMRYRTKEKSLFSALVENFSWVPLLMIFLGGVSLHVSQALLSHLFSVDMSWGATSKEVENTTFFAEIPKILKKFKITFLFCITTTAMMVVLATAVPVLWRIDLFIAIFPLSMVVAGHFLLPVALNPGLMRFTW